MIDHELQYELRSICSAIYDISREMERRDNTLLMIAKNTRNIGTPFVCLNNVLAATLAKNTELDHSSSEEKNAER